MNKIISGLSGIPDRQSKPRTSGLNIMYDHGISLRELESLFMHAEHIDALEIGYGPAFLVDDLKERVSLCKAHNITPFLTGFVFEVFKVRDKVNDYISMCKDINLKTFQVSDTCIQLSHYEKCVYIEKLSKHGTVYTRVGSQDAAHIIPPYKWIESMNAEISAGASLVFAESREAGNVGIYRGGGEVREGLVHEMVQHIPQEKIVWDTPHIAQQLYFIELLGGQCNCSRIKPELLLGFEAMRLGLSPRTFYLFFNKEEKV